VRSAADLNAYDVVVHERLVFTDDGYARLLERLAEPVAVAAADSEEVQDDA
jgi:hypothetical protein